MTSHVNYYCFTVTFMPQNHFIKGFLECIINQLNVMRQQMEGFVYNLVELVEKLQV